MMQPVKPHTFNPTILREYDVRGVVGETLNEADCRAVGATFGTLLARQGGRLAVVGQDGRPTSPSLTQAITEGLNGAGIDVVQIERGPTPMGYFAAYTLGADGCLVITGSHNPPEYNGIKMMLKGASFFGADIQKLGQMAAAGDFISGGRGRVSTHSVLNAYLDRLVEAYQLDRGLNVAWDAGNGAAGEVMAALAQRLPGRHVLLNEEIDGTFPNHHPDPTVEKNLAQLKAAVREQGCDLGVAFDGDGDRIGVVDSQGRVLWGDQILALLASELLAAEPGATVIADVKASQVLFDEVKRLGGRPMMWCTGHSLIKSKMAETGAPLAGEMSGHIFFGKGFYNYYGFDDALFAAVRLIGLVARSGRTLDALRDALPQTVSTPEIRFACPDEKKKSVIDGARQRLAATPCAKVIDIDGVRVQTGDGWWLLRASNTQPVLVARCESGSEEGLVRLKAALSETLRACGVEPPPFD